MSDEDEIIAAVQVTWNANNTLLVQFNPDESTWEFPKGNKLKLFNMIHWMISETERKALPRLVEANTDEDQQVELSSQDRDELPRKMNLKIQELLTKWAEAGDLIIRKSCLKK